MALEIHTLVQNADNQNVVFCQIVENNVLLVMVRAGRRLKFKAQLADMWVTGQEFETFPQAGIIPLCLCFAEFAE